MNNTDDNDNNNNNSNDDNNNANKNNTTHNNKNLKNSKTIVPHVEVLNLILLHLQLSQIVKTTLDLVCVGFYLQ